MNASLDIHDSYNLFVPYIEYTNGGSVLIMLGIDTSSSDYDDIVTIAKCLASCGHKVKVLHAIHYKDPLYNRVFGGLTGSRYFRKCPDLIVDGEFVEYESFTTDQHKHAFRNMLHHGLAQSDSIILRHCGLSDGYMLRKILSKIQEGVPVANVWIFDGQKIRLLYKTEG